MNMEDIDHEFMPLADYRRHGKDETHVGRKEVSKMDKIKLHPGDIFCSKNPMWLGAIINGSQKLWSKDNKSTYSHAGIIYGVAGTTREALWTVQSQNLFEAYAGDKVLIGRHEDMDGEAFEKGARFTQKHYKQWYPFWRLLFHIIPPVSKYLGFGRLVCSELVAKFIHGSGVQYMYWRGKNPDDIADMIHKWKGWQTVFEGIIEEEIA